MTSWRSLALALAVFSLAPPVHAQSAQSNDALAQKRFEEGRKLMSAGKLTEACPKFEESDRVAPSGGAVMNLAECYEKRGLLASAHAKYIEAAFRAAAAKRPDIEAVARDLAKKLEPRLTRVVIVVPADVDRPSLEVRRDNVAVPRNDWGQGVYVDPGEHTVEALIPGKKGWQSSFNVSANGSADNLTITIQLGGADKRPEPTPVAPVPQPSPPAATEPAPIVEPDTASKGSTQRVLGLSAAGAGLVALGVGTVFALSASSKRGDVESNCPAGVCRDPSFVTMNDDAKSSADTATILFIVGGVVGAGGAALFFTAPTSSSNRAARSSTTRVGGLVLPGGGAATLQGSW